MKKFLISVCLTVGLSASSFAQFGTPPQKLSLASSQKENHEWVNSGKIIRNAEDAQNFRIEKPTSQKTSAPVMVFSGSYASSNPEKATIKLVIDTVWSATSGYQMLLDSTHQFNSLYNEIYETVYQDTINYVYRTATHSIPKKVSALYDDGLFLSQYEYDSIEVYPGIYDLFVFNPFNHPSAGPVVFLAYGDYAHVNDIYFHAGRTYVFTVYGGSSGHDFVAFSPDYDLCLKRMTLPTSGCALEEMPVSITIENSGLYDVSEFYVNYCVEGTDDTVTEKISHLLKPNDTLDYTFTETKSIPKGTLCNVHSWITLIENECMTDNNHKSGIILRHDPVSIPYAFDIEDYGLFPLYENSWRYNGNAATALAGQAPLMSVCLDMTAGQKARITYDILAGNLVLGSIEVPDSYSIFFGKTSEPLSEWKEIFFDPYAFLLEYETRDISVEAPEDGTYAFYFALNHESYGFTVTNVRIDELAEYDVRLTDFSTDLAKHMMPASLANCNTIANVSIQNRGSADVEDVTVSISVNGKEIGSGTTKVGPTDTVVSTQIPISISGLESGTTAVFKASVTINGQTDSDMTNDTILYSIEITDALMAHDRIEDYMIDNDMYWMGTEGGSVSCGLIYNVPLKDTLTGISIGWVPTEEDEAIQLSVYKVNPSGDVELLFLTDERKGKNGGFRDYEIAPLILDPGDYIISVVISGFYLLTDRDLTEGIAYIISGGQIYAQTGVGFPGIRAIFAEGSQPFMKDVKVSGIIQPTTDGLFSANEDIVVRIDNFSSEPVVVPVNVTVNGESLETQNIEFSSYGRKDVTFTADLSAFDTKYDIVAFTSLEGDENTWNDTAWISVTSFPQPDPYVMNFEYCEDFSFDNFTPEWTTLDMDGVPSNGMGGFYFEGCEDPFAFVVFNPYTHDPSMESNGSILPHGGKKLGTAFYSNSGKNDDWLISPKLKMAESGAQVSMFVKSYILAYGLEEFNVLVSETDNKPESFTAIGNTLQAPIEWTEVVIDLSDYAGKEIHVAIQCVSEYRSIFMIDDIAIAKPTANYQPGRYEPSVFLYPNPSKETVVIEAKGETIRSVEILNISGSRVFQSAENLNQEQFRFNVSALPSGIYIARVKTGTGIATTKFVVQ